MGSLARYLPHPLVSVVFLLSFAGYLFCGAGVMDNPDTGWHLATGDLIRATHAIPATDPWSYFAGQVPWYDISWLWDVLISFIAAYTGLHGLYVFTAFITALSVAGLCWTLQKRALISDGYILLTLLLVWYVLLAYFCPQPWLATFLLTIAFQYQLHESRSNSGNRGIYIILPILMALWVNLHGGFIVGLSMIAIYAIEAQQTGNFKWLKRLIVCGMICGFACFVNPYGVYIIPAVMRTMNSVITAYLADWHPITIGSETNLTLFLLLFIFASNLREPRIPMADKILTMGWMIYALHTRRNFAVFALVAAPYLAFCLQEVARYSQGTKYKELQLFANVSGLRGKMAGFVILVSCLVAILPVPPEKLLADPMEIKPAMEYVKLHMPNAHFANDYNIGGALLYLSHGQWKTFGDGRAGTAYSEDMLKDIISFGSEDYQPVLDHYGLNAVIVLKHHPFATANADRKDGLWKEVFSNDHVLVFERKNR